MINTDNPNTSSSASDTKTVTGKEKGSTVTAPGLSLPKGGGAIKSIDEQFSVNAVNGTAGFSLPFPFSPSRNSFAPNLSLNYSSGSGNGPFGLGWTAEPPSIHRRTDKQLPLYHDANDSDVFQYAATEDLVPSYSDDGLGNWLKDEKTIGGDLVTRYRPRVENAFAAIEHVKEITGNIYWRVITKDNTTSVFGKSAQARVADPNEPSRIFKWLLEFSADDKGNCYSLEYKKENLENVGNALHEKNRLSNLALITNTYLKKINYANKESYLLNRTPEFLLTLILDYGEHDKTNPQINDTGLWSCRPDPFSDYHPGFEVRTYRLCQRLLMFHLFPELGPTPCLIKSAELSYSSSETFSFLSSYSQTGYIRKQDGSYSSQTSPPLEFTYQPLGWNTSVHSISQGNILNAPAGIDDKNYQWVDLYGEGISGILTEQANALIYKNNLGNGVFMPGITVAPKPSFSGVATGVLQLQDLEANGIKSLVSRDSQGYFELSEEGQWLPFRNFSSNPRINWADPNLKMLDLNGDGMADLLLTEEEVFTWYPASGMKGFDNAQRVQKATDEEAGPDLVFAFADPTESVVLTDMSGDGLSDIVRIRNGEVTYWPNLGYGRFGARVNMSNAPVFGSSDVFNPLYVKLADIDGSGTTDLIYLGKDSVKIYFNQSGNAFSDEKVITHFPKIDELATVSFIDLLGQGTNCLTWSSPLPNMATAPLQYIDLMGGKKPHLMIEYKNNLGKEVVLDYKPSTYYYLQDKQAGTPWATKLPFPVQCLCQVVTTDRITRTRFVNQYSYHHGFYDYAESEFRGFGRIDQTDTNNFEVYVTHVDPDGTQTVDERVFQKPVLTRSWFHTGAFINRDTLLTKFSSEYYQNLSEHSISEPALPANLLAEEYREAFRACKGIPLRVEVFCLDDSSLQQIPYTTSQHTCMVKLVQPLLQNKYASFYLQECEVLTYNYERNEQDPRIAHTLNLATDKFGNILQSAVIAYGRVMTDTDLSPEDQLIQGTTHIVYNSHNYTQLIDDTTNYRLPLLSETQTYDLTGAKPEADGFYISDKLQTSFQTALEINYEDDPTAGLIQKRLTEHIRHYFLRDDMTAPMPLGQLQSKALIWQSVKLALTPGLVSTRYGTSVSGTMLLNEGHYIHSEGDQNYWTPSSLQLYDPANFYQVVAVTDAFGNTTSITYDSVYHFYLQKITSPAINGTHHVSEIKQFSFRVLQPYLLQDINDNFSAVRFDELGLVIMTFQMGKAGENKGDSLDMLSTEASPNDRPGKSLEYKLNNWYDQTQTAGFDYTTYKPSPNVLKLSAREQHYYDNPAPKIQVSYSYSDGSGHEVMKKIQAEPGDVSMPDGTTATNVNPRWIGNGRMILNNKGNPVKQFEPFFSTTFAFEDDKDLVEGGVTPVLFYDPLGRLIRTVFPDGTLNTTVFDAWKQLSSDQDDTVLQSQWYTDRGSPDPTGPQPADKNTRAAWLAALLANTPTTDYFDSQARNFLSVHFNRTFKIDDVSHKAINITDTYLTTRTLLDIESNQLKVIDARSNTVVEYQYDMLSHRIYQKNMDAGERWFLHNCMEKPQQNWDSQTPFPPGGTQHVFSYEYDSLLRPVKSYLSKDGAAKINFELVVYGEGLPNDKSFNLRGQTAQHYDTSGKIMNAEFDFKGNLLTSTRQLLSNYKDDPNWDIVQGLDSDIYTLSGTFDALNRPVTVKAPDKSIITPSYNEANLLETVQVNIQENASTTSFIKDINYNEKGQRESILYGNNVKTNYTYDKKTFRLIEVQTFGKNGTDLLQQLSYTYDASGNITTVKDEAQQSFYFNNAVVNSSSDFVYDALYRLISAYGREHIGQNQPLTPFDEFRTNQPQPGDGNAMRNYVQQYQYDAVGNMLQMIHVAGAGSWTRGFTYETNTNRLKSDAVGSFTENIAYDLHGNMNGMAHLPVMDWNFNDQLKHVDLIGGGNVYYTYDSGGSRVRKVNELQGGLIKERIYLGIFELYRERNAGTITFERQTLHVMDEKNCIALIETLTKGSDNGPPQLIRYQLSNHLGSAALELDEQGTIISYEEYYPYGSTSYQAVNKAINASAKRYRYTGMERDEETGLEYHGARYYIPWLARWSKCDPTGISDGINDYVYCSNNPVIKLDKKGTDGTNWNNTVDAQGRPVYQSTGDQVGTDSGKVAKAGGDAFLKSDDFKALKKLVLDPELSKLKTSFSKDWDKDKGSIIVGGIFILLPTAALLASAAVANPKLDVPVVGDFYPRQGVLALASLGTEALTEGITKERFKLGFGYEKKNGLDVYSFELTFKGPKAPDADKTKADADKKTPGAAQKTPQQKELDKTRAEIGAPGSITLSGKVGPGQGEGTFKVDKPTDLGRLSVAPTFKVGPQGPAFATSVSLTSLILGNRIQFTGSAFANAPRPTGASVFDAKYDDPSKSLTVTTTPPLSGNGFWVGVQGRF